MRLFVDSLNWKILFFLKGIGVLFSKACLCYFYNLSKESISKMMKEAFYFIKKLFLLWRYSSFCDFSASFPYFPDSKGQIKLKWLLWICLHKLAKVVFGITQKPLYIKSSTLPKCDRSLAKEFLWTCFETRRETGI